MKDHPQSRDELRRMACAQATEPVPDHFREFLNRSPPRRDSRFLERAAPAGDEKSPERPRLEGYRPPWLASAYAPRRVRRPKPPVVVHHGQRLEPAITYPPDERKTYNDLSYPWGCVCKVTTAAGVPGSGALVGPRHVLTASHCIDWSTSDAERVDVHLTGSTAAATAFATSVYAFSKVSGDPSITTLDEDYACIVLDQRLGDVFGWFGTRTYDSAWDGDDVWSSVGYPGDIAGGLQPTFILNKSMDEDEWDYGTGRAMTTAADMEKGQSGSPMFAWFDGDPYVVAVMSAHGNVWASGVENWCSGGSDLPRLVKRARDENP